MLLDSVVRGARAAFNKRAFGAREIQNMVTRERA